MIYPVSVLLVTTAILVVLTTFIIPRFQSVFEGLLNGRPLPGFTLLVINLSSQFRHHFPVLLVAMAVAVAAVLCARQTRAGRRGLDRLKLSAPVMGRMFRKLALGRFARTLGTLLGSGVPILQALAIARETAGNVVVGDVIGRIHDSVKEGGTVAGPLKEAGIFPPLVAGMVDVGEQAGALPDMLLRIADNCDDELDNDVNAVTALLEPAMIIFLAIVVGSVVIAMFLPILVAINPGGPSPAGDGGM